MSIQGSVPVFKQEQTVAIGRDAPVQAKFRMAAESLESRQQIDDV